MANPKNDTTARDRPAVDPSNADQLAAWDGANGEMWAADADYFDRSVARYQPLLIGAAAIEPGDQVLDVGCGAGRTTLDAASAAGAGSALGIDLSGAMLDVARRRAADEAVTNARFLQGDAQVHPFPAAAFDRVISRTGTMFFGDAVAGFRNIAHAMRPGGRLVIMTWQPAARNEWFCAFTTALAAGRDLPAPPPEAPGPFSQADRDRVRAVLHEAGFGAVEFTDAVEPMWFGNNADHAVHMMGGLFGWMLEGLDADRRRRALDALGASMAAHLTGAGVEYPSAAWIVSATRGESAGAAK